MIVATLREVIYSKVQYIQEVTNVFVFAPFIFPVTPLLFLLQYSELRMASSDQRAS